MRISRTQLYFPSFSPFLLFFEDFSIYFHLFETWQRWQHFLGAKKKSTGFFYDSFLRELEKQKKFFPTART